MRVQPGRSTGLKPPVFSQPVGQKERMMWMDFVESNRKCTQCRCDGLLDTEAFPVFQKEAPRSFDILFILEAPNRDDTYNPKKGYLTVDHDTDPSGRLFYDLFTAELLFPLNDLFVTNSVLCLPAEKTGKFPVSTPQRRNCLPVLRQLIDIFNPLIVCPMGTKALLATDRICSHGLRTMAMAVANPLSWYDRILFPLFHTSAQARNPRNGRPEPQQRADWQKLRTVWEQARAQQGRLEHNKTWNPMGSGLDNLITGDRL